MPYITKELRRTFDRFAADGHHPITSTPGELNYELTLKCLKYLSLHGTSYTTMNAVIGALECCKQEFYRRMAVPYEDQKIKENGDVFPCKTPSEK